MRTTSKKLVAMLIAALLASGIAGMMGVSAEPVYNAELFTGGDVESATESSFGGVWTDTTKPQKGIRELEHSIVHSGKNAIKITSEQADNKEYVNITGRFAGTAMAASATRVRGYIKFEEFSTDSYVQVGLYYGAIADTRELKSSTNKFESACDWTGFECWSNTTQTDLYLDIRLYGSGIIYVDDVSAMEVENLIAPHPAQPGRCYFTDKKNATGFFGSTTDEKFTGDYSMYFLYKGNTTCQIWMPVSIRGKAGEADWRPDGKKYVLSFRFKPEQEGRNPSVNIRSNKDKVHADLPATLMIKGDVQNGWQLYKAYFTMPDTNGEAINVMLGSYAGAGNGYYDDFQLVEDRDGAIEILDATGNAAVSVSAGDALTIKQHLISDKTEEAGGRTVMVVVASYVTVNGVRSCVDVQLENKTVYDGVDVMKNATTKYFTKGADDVTISYTVPADAAGGTVKAFCWDDTVSLHPQSHSDAVSVTA